MCLMSENGVSASCMRVLLGRTLRDGPSLGLSRVHHGCEGRFAPPFNYVPPPGFLPCDFHGTTLLKAAFLLKSWCPPSVHRPLNSLSQNHPFSHLLSETVLSPCPAVQDLRLASPESHFLASPEPPSLPPTVVLDSPIYSPSMCSAGFGPKPGPSISLWGV